MEFVRVIYEKEGRPIRRNVFTDARRASIGKTNTVIPIGKGVQRLHLGTPDNYAPPRHRAVIRGTTQARPATVRFTPS